MKKEPIQGTYICKESPPVWSIPYKMLKKNAIQLIFSATIFGFIWTINTVNNSNDVWCILYAFFIRCKCCEMWNFHPISFHTVQLCARWTHLIHLFGWFMCVLRTVYDDILIFIHCDCFFDHIHLNNFAFGLYFGLLSLKEIFMADSITPLSHRNSNLCGVVYYCSVVCCLSFEITAYHFILSA